MSFKGSSDHLTWMHQKLKKQRTSRIPLRFYRTVKTFISFQSNTFVYMCVYIYLYIYIRRVTDVILIFKYVWLWNIFNNNFYFSQGTAYGRYASQSKLSEPANSLEFCEDGFELRPVHRVRPPHNPVRSTSVMFCFSFRVCWRIRGGRTEETGTGRRSLQAGFKTIAIYHNSAELREGRHRTKLGKMTPTRRPQLQVKLGKLGLSSASHQMGMSGSSQPQKGCWVFNSE